MSNSPEAKINSLRGIPWMGFPPDITTGNIWFVDSGHPLASNNTNCGESPLEPFATVDYAVGKCTADNGDIIYVMPGHAETVNATATLTCDVAGISIVGLGNGTNRPLITLATSTAATISVTAGNVRIKNLQVTVGVDACLKVFTITANDCTIEDCLVLGGATYQFSSCFNLTTTYDNLTVKRCTVLQSTDPNLVDAAVDTGVFYIVDSENVVVEDCYFYGNFESAIFHNKTTLVNGLWIKNCMGGCLLATCFPYVQVADAVGGDTGSYWFVPQAADLTGATVGGTVSNKFFSAARFGNDGASGDQGAGVMTATA